MATIYEWNPFGVALDITATKSTVTRTSATKYTVKINVHWETYYSGARTNYGMTATSGGRSVTLNPFGTYSSSGNGVLTGTYSISGNGSATKTITVTFKNFNNDNGDSATKTVSFDVTVPALQSYTVSYNMNGGTGTISNQTKWKDQTLTLSSTKPIKTGYAFLGWGTSSTSTTVAYNSGGSYTSNSSIILYAVWSINKVRIAYHPNGGTVSVSGYGYNQYGWITSNDVTYFHNINYGVSADPYNATTFGLTKEGCTFGGWRVEYNGEILNQDTDYASTKYVDHADGKTTTNKNVVTCYLYAVWNVNGYTDTFNLNGGISGGGTFGVDYGATYTVPVAIRNGFEFLGWFTAKTGGTKVYNGGETVTQNSSNDTYYAQWKPLGSVYIDNNESVDRYLVYMDNGDGWYLYIPYIDNGDSWDLLA